MGGKERYVFFIQEMLERIRRSAQVGKPAAIRLRNPGVVIAVAAKDDALVLLNRAADQIMQRSLEIRCSFENVRILFERFRNRRVDHNVCIRNGYRRARHAELEFVSRKRKG